jgi:hypothetical protein
VCFKARKTFVTSAPRSRDTDPGSGTHTIMIKQLRRLAVAFSRGVLLLLSVAMISILAGCGKSTTNVQNPPPPNVPAVAIAFQPAPPGSIPINTTTALTAVVSNDSSNAGVDWSLLCAKNANCGTLSPLHTDSGQAATYTPPPIIPGNSQTVTIEAFATADHNKNLVTPVTVTGFGSGLKGSYVLQAQGVDVNGGPNYQFAGVITLDGNGGIMAAEQTVNFLDTNLNGGSYVSKLDTITGGSYFLGPDGRGLITLLTNDADIGGNGVESFAFVYLSSSHALITQMDLALPGTPPAHVPATGVSASGTMDLQTWTSNTPPLSGGYAFVVAGSDFASGLPSAIGGIINIDSLPNNPNNISGKGSVTDQTLNGTLTAFQPLSGTVSNPDSFGAVTINLTVPGFTTPTLQFTGYVVDATHIHLIESDNPPGAGGIGSTAGVAIGQGSATGTFKDNTFFSGTYVLGILGVDLAGATPATLTSANLFQADGLGHLANGFTDTFLELNGNQPPNFSGAQISAQFGGTYSVNTTGTGRVRVFFNQFVPRPIPVFQPEFFFYLTGNGNPPLVLDVGDTAHNYPNLGVGIAYPQVAPPFSLNGKYGVNFTQNSFGTENDATARITVNASTQALSGVLDTNFAFSALPDTPLTGGFGTMPNGGRFNGALTNTFFPTPGSTPNTIAAEFYLIDSGHGLFIETDSLVSGEFSLGYFATRAPVCQGCP